VVLEAGLTVSVSAVEVLAEKFVSPLYTAVMECVPGSRPLYIMRAGPPAERVAVLRLVVPSINVTVPVGVPPVEGETVTMKVTHWLNTLGFGLAVTVVVVGAWLIVSVRTAEVLGAKFALPE
jgi:hypothetical protein